MLHFFDIDMETGQIDGGARVWTTTATKTEAPRANRRRGWNVHGNRQSPRTLPA